MAEIKKQDTDKKVEAKLEKEKCASEKAQDQSNMQEVEIEDLAIDGICGVY